MLDTGTPIAVLLLAVLHHLTDDQAFPAVRALVDAIPVGSYLVVSHATTDFMTPEVAGTVTALPATEHGRWAPRSRADVARFLDGLDVVRPGLVPVADRRRPRDGQVTVKQCAAYAAVARKPPHR